MFRKVKEALSARAVDRVRVRPHPALGVLRLSDDGDWWETEVATETGRIAFKIGGEREPDPALLAHAVEILNDIPRFRERIAAFLRHEAQGAPAEVRSELEQLEI